MNKIIIKDLEVFGYHGVLVEENKLGQKFLISIELTLNSIVTDDHLESTVNYAKLCKEVATVFNETVFNLIESVANKLCETILQNYPQVEKAFVELKKPWAPIHMNLQYAAVSVERKWHLAYLGVGSNMGDKLENINQAIKLIEDSKHTLVIKASKLIETKPVGYLEQDDFVNGAIEIKTYLTPEELLRFLLGIEKELRRERTIKNGPRTLDLDVLLYDSLINNNSQIIIPHPRMHERLFVLEPLSEIAEHIVHPIKQCRIGDLLNQLKSKQEYICLKVNDTVH